MSSKQTDSNPVILCLDTAYGGLSVGLLAADGQTYASYEDTQYEQASNIVTAIDAILNTANTDKAALRAVLVTVGPGSFTGVRLALSVAKTLALALNIRVLPVSCFDVLAWKATQNSEISGQRFAAVIKNKPQSYYVQFFDENGVSMDDPICCSQSDLEKKCSYLEIKKIIGNSDNANYAIKSLDGEAMGHCGKIFFTYPNLRYDAVPLYLREADISFPKKEQRKLL